MSTVNIPESLIERAKAVTGQTRREAAIRAAIELAEAGAKVKPKAARKAAVKAADVKPTVSYAQLVREEKRPGGKRFTSAKAAIKWLQS